MELTISVSAQLMTLAKNRGLEPSAYAEELIRAELMRSETEAAERSFASVASAIARSKTLRIGNRLDGMSSRELVREGRKY